VGGGGGGSSSGGGGGGLCTFSLKKSKKKPTLTLRTSYFIDMKRYFLVLILMLWSALWLVKGMKASFHLTIEAIAPLPYSVLNGDYDDNDDGNGIGNGDQSMNGNYNNTRRRSSTNSATTTDTDTDTDNGNGNRNEDENRAVQPVNEDIATYDPDLVAAAGDVFTPLSGFYWGLEEGAWIRVNITSAEPKDTILTILLYTYTQYSLAEETQDHYWNFVPSLYRAEFSGNFFLEKMIAISDRYYVIIKTKDFQTVEIDGDYEFYNPQSGELNVNEAPYYGAGMLILIFEGLGLICWATLIFRHWKNLFTVQIILSCVYFFELSKMVCVLFHYRVMAATGQDSEALKYGISIFYLLSDTSFLAIILLTSIGWSIIRNELSGREKHIFGGFFITYSGINAAYGFCVSATYCGAFHLTQQIVRFLLAFGIIVSINYNIETLRSIAYSISFSRQKPADYKPLYAKLNLFLTLRRIFTAYSVTPVGLLFVNFAVFSWKETWASTFLEQSLMLFFYALIGYVFRPRDPNYYFVTRPNHPEANPNTNLDNVESNSESGRDSATESSSSSNITLNTESIQTRNISETHQERNNSGRSRIRIIQTRNRQNNNNRISNEIEMNVMTPPQQQ